MAHERWLKQELMKALSWDDMIVDGVVDVISKANSADDEHVKDIVQVNPAGAAAAAAVRCNTATDGSSRAAAAAAAAGLALVAASRLLCLVDLSWLCQYKLVMETMQCICSMCACCITDLSAIGIALCGSTITTSLVLQLTLDVPCHDVLVST
jgi:hypothetical protein